MTATLEPEAKSTSRRALLAGALGGVGALVATAIGHASPARGADGATVHVGDELAGSSVTKISNGLNGAAVIQGASTTGTGIYGTSSSSRGVYGTSVSNFGVQGDSDSYIGVYGTSSTNVAVYGSSNGDASAAVAGRSLGNSTGVIGSSGILPAALSLTGVFGYANQSKFSRGVVGASPAGHGIHGQSTSGWAGYFAGKVYLSRFQEMKEISPPAAPRANRARLFLRDNGSGKTQLCVRFNTGGVLVIKTQP